MACGDRCKTYDWRARSSACLVVIATYPSGSMIRVRGDAGAKDAFRASSLTAELAWAEVRRSKMSVPECGVTG